MVVLVRLKWEQELEHSLHCPWWPSRAFSVPNRSLRICPEIPVGAQMRVPHLWLHWVLLWNLCCSICFLRFSFFNGNFAYIQGKWKKNMCASMDQWPQHQALSAVSTVSCTLEKVGCVRTEPWDHRDRDSARKTCLLLWIRNLSSSFGIVLR